jgi:drug/metabolite transporter (DMT)-like permease/hydrogenase maturation factor
MCLGTVGQVTAVGPARYVQIRGGGRDITASLLAVSDAVGPGDWVLVHSGLVLARLTEHEARDALQLRDPTSEGVRRTGLLLALGTACISGVAIFLNSYGVSAFGDPTTYTTAKNVVAALVLVALTAAMSASRGGTVLTRPSRPRQWAGLTVVGVIGGAVAFVLFFEGLARASSVDAAFLQKSLLVWVALLAVPLLGERLGALQVGAIALLVLGQIGLAGGVTTVFGQGQLMVLGATLLWAAEVVVVKALLADLSSWTVGLTRMGVGSVVLVAWTLLRGEGGALTALTGAQWRWVLLTGVVLAGYVATWFAALSRAPAVDVTAVLVVGAVVTALLAAGVNGAPLVPRLGWVALVLLGAILVAVPARRGRDALAGAT